MNSRTLALFFACLVPLAHAAVAGAVRIVVDTLDDTDLADGDCSLREAIRAANQDAPYRGCVGGSDGDRIEFAVTGRIDLASDLPIVREDLTIAGPGVADLIVDGAGLHRILFLDGPEEEIRLTVRDLTLREGFQTTFGGCVAVRRTHLLELERVRLVACRSESSGGAVASDGARSVRILRSEIRDGVALGAGGIAIFGEGAGPAHRGGFASTFLIEDTTVSGGFAGGESAAGGVAVVLAQGTIRRSTLSGNSAENAGGGLVVIAGDVLLEDSTITGNVADADGDDADHAGGGIFLVGVDEAQPATMAIRNSIVAGNEEDIGENDVAVSDFAGVLTLGFNFVGTNVGATAQFPAGQPNLAGDWVGTGAQPLDAELGPLDDEGGPTSTHLPEPGSPVVDRGSCPGARRDQRGFGDPGTDLRPVDNPVVPDEEDGCDIGAVERGAEELSEVLFADGFESGDFDAWSEVVAP